MKRILLFMLAGIMIMAGLGACSPSAPSVQPEKPIVRYANFKVYDPVCVGVAMKFYDQHGIDVQFIGDTLGGPTAIQAVAAGRAEAALSSIPALINANAAGLPVAGVTDIQSAIEGQPLEEFFVRTDSNIKDIHDLKGKKVAVNLWKSSFHYTWLMALDKAGMKADDVEFELMSFADQSTALDAGAVDAIGLIQPYTSMADSVFAGKFKRLFTALDVFGPKQFTLHFVNKIWAKDHPEQAKAFVQGTVDAINYIEAHEQEVKPIIAACTGIDVKYVPDYHFQKDGQVIPNDVAFWLDYMKKSGDLSADWLKPEDIFTNDYR